MNTWISSHGSSRAGEGFVCARARANERVFYLKRRCGKPEITGAAKGASSGQTRGFKRNVLKNSEKEKGCFVQDG